MDLETLDFKVSAPAKMTLMHPVTQTEMEGDDGKHIFIEVRSADSDEFRKAMRGFGNRKLSKNSKKQTVEEIEEMSCRVLAAATVGWSENFKIRGESWKCSEDSAFALYTEFAWIREQVDAFVNERANFLIGA